jgi:hypothetical protein
MANNTFSTIKTDNSLLQAMSTAASIQLTPSQLLEQRTSFVYGSMKSDSSITRDRIKQVLQEQATGKV